MDINLIKENVKMEQSIQTVCTQILLEGDIIVPDINPDIFEILENEANIIIDRINVSENRINYAGKLETQILYSAKGIDNAEIFSMSSIIPIDDFMNIDNIDENMWADIIPTIQNTDYSVLNDRKISTKFIVNIDIYVHKQEIVEFVVDTENLLEKQIKKSTININKIVDKTSDRFILKDQLFVTQSSGNIKTILRKDAKIINKEYNCSNGKVYVSADVAVSILYKGDTADSIIDILEKEISFNGYIDVQGSKEDMYSYVDLNVVEFNCDIKTDDDGEDRVFDVEVSIFANCKVFKEEEINILEDGYIIGKELLFEKKEIKYPKLICRNRNQSTIKEVIKVDGEDVLQVFKVSANSVIEDIIINEDRLICEGIINVSVLYIAQSDDNPLCSYKTVLPFRQVIEVRGAKSYMEKKVSSCIDHIGFNMLTDKEIELRILTSFNAQVVEINKKNVVTDVNIVDKTKDDIEKMPSIIVYIVQKDDKLWDIAKKYNTDIDDIIEVNQIENQDFIFEGQKLVILKKIVI